MVTNRILLSRDLLFLAGYSVSNFQAWSEDETSHHFDLQANVPYVARGDETLKIFMCLGERGPTRASS